MKLRLLIVSLALASLVPATKAASFLEVVNGSAARSTTGATQIVGSGLDFTVGKLRLSLDAGQQAFISYSFEGAEAAQRNQFFGPGGSSMIDSLASVGTMITTRIDAGLLDVSFQSVGATAAGNRSTSNAHNYGWNDANVGIVLDRSGLSGRLLFEDGRGRLGSDYDYDDMVIKFSVNVSPVPEASSAAMLFAGFGLMAWMQRRRRSRA
jgi:PEP-CTERM motif